MVRELNPRDISVGIGLANRPTYHSSNHPKENMIPGETILSQQKLGYEINPHTSEFKVLHSGGGYYIGTLFIACGEKNCKECAEYIFGDRILIKGQELDHNSRETDYFDTKEEAE